MIDAWTCFRPRNQNQDNRHVFAVLSMLVPRDMLCNAARYWCKLDYVVLRYAMLRHAAVLCWAAPYCAVLRYAAVQCCTMLLRAVLRCTTPCHAWLCLAMLGCARLG